MLFRKDLCKPLVCLSKFISMQLLIKPGNEAPVCLAAQQACILVLAASIRAERKTVSRGMPLKCNNCCTCSKYPI